jgi:hypothetical protein
MAGARSAVEGALLFGDTLAPFPDDVAPESPVTSLGKILYHYEYAAARHRLEVARRYSHLRSVPPGRRERVLVRRNKTLLDRLPLRRRSQEHVASGLVEGRISRLKPGECQKPAEAHLQELLERAKVRQHNETQATASHHLIMGLVECGQA